MGGGEIILTCVTKLLYNVTVFPRHKLFSFLRIEYLGEHYLTIREIPV